MLPLLPRFDPYSMGQPEIEEARLAMDQLIRVINENLTGVSLLPGECLFIDNYKAVHWRSFFKARFDGTDRWFKWITVARSKEIAWRSQRASVPSYSLRNCSEMGR